MNLTLEDLKARRAQLSAEKEQHEARANATIGAVAMLDELIATLTAPEPDRPEAPAPPSTQEPPAIETPDPPPP